MLRTIRAWAVLCLGVLCGFLATVYFTFSFNINFGREKGDYQIVTLPSGDVLKVPTHTDAWTFSAHSEPYRPAPVVDLFDNKDAKP